MLSLRRSPRFIAVLVLVTALGPLATHMFLPSLETVRAHFAVDPGTGWLAFTLPVAAIGIATLLFGPLSDRFGRKPILIAGLAVFVAGSVLGAIGTDIGLVVGGRVLQAAGASAGIVLSRAIARDVYGFEDSIRVISYLTMAMVIAPILSPVAGGALHDAFGWQSIFYVMLAVGLMALPLAAWALIETIGQRQTGGWRAMAFDTAALMHDRRFLGYALISTASMCVFFAFLAAAPYLMTGVLGRSASEYGIWFLSVSGVFVVGTFASTRLLRRFGVDRLIIAGTILTLPALTAMIVLHLAFALDAALLFVPVCVVSVLQGLIIPNCQACAINVNPRRAGTASGLTGFLQMAAAALVSQAVGQLADGSVWPMVALMAACAVAGALLVPLIRTAVVRTAIRAPTTKL